MDSKRIEHEPETELKEKTWLKIFKDASEEELSQSTIVRSKKLPDDGGTIHFIISKPEAVEKVKPLGTFWHLRIEIDTPAMFDIRARISTDPEATMSLGLPESEDGLIVFSKWLKPQRHAINPANPFDVPIIKTQELEIEVSKAAADTKSIRKGKQSGGRMPFTWF